MNDRTTVRITAKGEQIIARLLEDGFFHDRKDAAKFALALAIKQKLKPEFEGTRDGTNWNIGTLDNDGKLKETISVFYPDTEVPFQFAENLINVGLVAMEEKLKEGIDPLELLAKPAH